MSGQGKEGRGRELLRRRRKAARLIAEADPSAAAIRFEVGDRVAIIARVRGPGSEATVISLAPFICRSLDDLTWTNVPPNNVKRIGSSSAASLSFAIAECGIARGSLSSTIEFNVARVRKHAEAELLRWHRLADQAEASGRNDDAAVHRNRARVAQDVLDTLVGRCPWAKSARGSQCLRCDATGAVETPSGAKRLCPHCKGACHYRKITLPRVELTAPLHRHAADIQAHARAGQEWPGWMRALGIDSGVANKWIARHGKRSPDAVGSPQSGVRRLFINGEEVQTYDGSFTKPNHSSARVVRRGEQTMTGVHAMRPREVVQDRRVGVSIDLDKIITSRGWMPPSTMFARRAWSGPDPGNGGSPWMGFYLHPRWRQAEILEEIPF